MGCCHSADPNPSRPPRAAPRKPNNKLHHPRPPAEPHPALVPAVPVATATAGRVSVEVAGDVRGSVVYLDAMRSEAPFGQSAATRVPIVLNARVADSRNTRLQHADEASSFRRLILGVPEGLTARGMFKISLNETVYKIVLPMNYKRGQAVVVLVPIPKSGAQSGEIAEGRSSYIENEVSETSYS